MQIRYLDCNGKRKLFSFDRHSRTEWTDAESKITYYIQGDVTGGYLDHSPNGTLVRGEIADLIKEIRNEYKIKVKTQDIPIKDIPSIELLSFLHSKIDRAPKSTYRNSGHRYFEEFGSIVNESTKCLYVIVIQELTYRLKKGIA